MQVKPFNEFGPNRDILGYPKSASAKEYRAAQRANAQNVKVFLTSITVLGLGIGVGLYIGVKAILNSIEG